MRKFMGAAEPHGFTTPGDVLAYRKTWDSYVVGTSNAMSACADEWDKAATTGDVSKVNVAQFGGKYGASTLKLWAQQRRTDANTIMWRWNQYRDTPDATLVLNAGSILIAEQEAVLKVGQFYRPLIRQDCPSIVLPQPPSFDLQAQVIGRLEGLELFAHGTLQILGTGASGSLEVMQQLGQKAGAVVDTVASPWPWIAVGLIAVAVTAVEVAPLLRAGRRTGRAMAESRARAIHLVRGR